MRGVTFESLWISLWYITCKLRCRSVAKHGRDGVWTVERRRLLARRHGGCRPSCAAGGIAVQVVSALQAVTAALRTANRAAITLREAPERERPHGARGSGASCRLTSYIWSRKRPSKPSNATATRRRSVSRTRSRPAQHRPRRGSGGRAAHRQLLPIYRARRAAHDLSPTCGGASPAAFSGRGGLLAGNA